MKKFIMVILLPFALLIDGFGGYDYKNQCASTGATRGLISWALDK